jgi:hypothetical protein
MAQVKRRGEGRYLIRVSRGTGKNREYVNETFHGTLAEARAHAREIESSVHRQPDDFKAKLLAALHDPMVAEAVANAMKNNIKKDPSGLRLVRAETAGAGA